ncbi:hypothetical protein EVAR_31902_1 [Eumeta japonica]|uniref:Uncharacterized protein n=1 Tax=Eumeta variegata TaxID=151549 RepID=A0A4C1XNS0_EUMVA|nr:hypothetical protein EVAR_31902_1 [Eumeta japonica]
MIGDACIRMTAPSRANSIYSNEAGRGSYIAAEAKTGFTRLSDSQIHPHHDVDGRSTTVRFTHAQLSAVGTSKLWNEVSIAIFLNIKDVERLRDGNALNDIAGVHGRR